MQVSKVNYQSRLPFQGMAVLAPARMISNASDVIQQWGVLKHPKYTNIFQEMEEPSKAQILENKQIRDQNYSFLDQLKDTAEKSKFIEYFKNFTGFPSLEDSSQKILGEFDRVLKYVKRFFADDNGNVLLSGYDRYCSVGLDKAFPGSDLDKGYAIFEGPSSGTLFTGKAFSENIKGIIWNNIDNRLMSVNHCAAFPNVISALEVKINMDKFDTYASTFVNDDNLIQYKLIRMNCPNPISASKFNIWLSELLPTRQDKVDAKNFAYIIEAIRDGNTINRDRDFTWMFYDEMNRSAFSWCSNITQAYQMEQKLMYGDVVKHKLKAREEAAKNFNSWSIDRQYELVKDIIRSMSGDSKNPEFKDLFHSRVDKHRLLINDILVGDVACYFDTSPRGNEVIMLEPLTDKTLERYCSFNPFKTD